MIHTRARTETRPRRQAAKQPAGTAPHPRDSERGPAIVKHTPSPRHPGGVVPAAPSRRRSPLRPIADASLEPPGEILTVPEAADRMNMSVRYVRRLVSDRRIAFHRIGRAIRLAASDVDAHVAACRVEPLTVSDAWRDLKSVV